jgi:hypothetical protein
MILAHTVNKHHGLTIRIELSVASGDIGDMFVNL